VTKTTVTSPKIAAHSTKVYDALVELKAFCVATYAETTDMTATMASKSSSIVPFLKAFGADPEMGVKKDKGGIISEYSLLYANMEAQYSGGLGLYMLQKLNAAILEGRQLLKMEKGKWMIDTAELGLQSTPSYMKGAQATAAAQMTAKSKIVENNEGSDTAAALQYVTNKHNIAFASFWKLEEAKEQAARNAFKSNQVAEVVPATYAAFASAVAVDEKTKVLHAAVQASAAITKVDDLEAKESSPSMTDEQMKLNAAAAAAKVDAASKAKVDSLPNLIKGRSNHYYHIWTCNPRFYSPRWTLSLS